MDIGSDFLDMIPKAQMTKAKITEQNKIKELTIFISKITLNVNVSDLNILTKEQKD